MKKHIWILSAALLILLSACHAEPTPPDGASESEADTGAASAAYRTISPAGVHALLNNGKDILLLDVRRADEYEEKHIPGAVLLPNEEIGDTRPAALPEIDATIILYCRSGNRSREAAEKLLALGYTDVRDLGGIEDWPYATVSGAEAGTWTGSAVTPGILTTFTAQDLNGAVIDESALADYKLTMVNVWATFCGPCLREMPDLGALSAEYEPQGVQIVGMISDVLDSQGAIDEKQLSTAREIVAATKAAYPHILPSPELFGLLYQITSVPTTFFVDANGNQVGSAYVGSRTKEAWAEIIDAVLQEIKE